MALWVREFWSMSFFKTPLTCVINQAVYISVYFVYYFREFNVIFAELECSHIL